MKAGEEFTVRLEEATTQPELPTPEELKEDPNLAETIHRRLVSYTWPAATTYRDLDALLRDLNAQTLPGGAPNPLHGVVKVSKTPIVIQEDGEDKRVDVLVLEASQAIDWEVRMSFPPEPSATILQALGFAEGRKHKDATQTVGGFQNIVAWLLAKKAPKWNAMYTIAIASGCIAGESIMGVILAGLVALGLM